MLFKTSRVEVVAKTEPFQWRSRRMDRGQHQTGDFISANTAETLYLVTSLVLIKFITDKVVSVIISCLAVW